MILYRLLCDQDHGFEAWFRDSGAFDKQAQLGLLSCPTCGTAKVGKALMTPRIGKSPVQKPADVQPPAPPAVPPKVAENVALMRKQLLSLRRHIEKSCDYVGPRFAEEARRIHYGETDPHGIYGEASKREAEALLEEGIDIGAVPWLPKDNA